VLHLESPYLDAFGSDTSFLLTIARCLSLYHDRLQGSFDSEFIAEKIAYFGRTHDLRNYANSLSADPEKAEIADSIRTIMGLMLDDDRLNESEPSAFSIEDVVGPLLLEERAQGQEAITDAALRVKIANNGCQIFASKHARRSIAFIVENLFTNMIRYHRRPSGSIMRIKLLPDAFPHIGRIDGLLAIDYVIAPALSQEVEANIGTRPVVHPARGTRIGFYTVGLVTRMLGGHITARRPMEIKSEEPAGHDGPDETKTVISLRIPIPLRRACANQGRGVQ
jgi:hypothetical protein